MHQKVEINSFLVTKLKDDNNLFTKYDIEASIDEVESEEDHIRLKYRFVLLSNPTNVKISIDGFTTVYGNQQEMSRHLSNDDKNIPRVVNTLYQEIFPFLYTTAKTMQIPCPAYRLSEITKSSQGLMAPPLEQVEEKEMELSNPMHDLADHDSEIQPESAESIVQEQKIHTV